MSKWRSGTRAIDHARIDLELEIDHRRAHDLDAVDAAQNLGRVEVEIHILLLGPDPPLAAVDRLARPESAVP